MNTKVTEIAPDVYRISTFHPDYGIQFNQFLIKDEEPFLMHTGFKKMFSNTLEAVSSVIDPSSLRWIGFSHFEADECGALNEWLGTAPHAQAVCSFVGAEVNLKDFADRPARALSDNEVFEIGRHRLRFLATPHFPHGWDAGLFFEENDRTLLCSDLFFHPGDPEPMIESGIMERARGSIMAGLAGPLAKDMPYTPYTDSTLQRLAALEPQTLALMHGSSFRGDGRASIISLADRPAEKASYKYTLEVKTTSAKQISRVAWDYVFTDPRTHREALRHSFESKVKIRPGGSAKVTAYKNEGPYQVVDANGSSGKSGERIVIKRIVYSDGSVWEG